MSLTNLRLSDFKRIAKLLTRKEELLQMVADIDRELGQFDRDSGQERTLNKSAARRGRPPKVGRRGQPARNGVKRRSGRGKLKEQIIEVLKQAGKQGIHVKELVKQTGAKEPNVRVWFYATGKKIKNIKQIAPATYAWVD
jgi:hypothetical protein